MKAERIPYTQFWLATAAPLVTTAFFTFPRAAALQTATAAPWVLILGGLLVLLAFWPIANTLARRPGDGLADLALAAGGRPMAIATALLLSGYLLLTSGIQVRQVSEMVVTALYPHTPQTFAMASLVIVAAVGATMHPPGAGWVSAQWAVLTLFCVLILAVGSIAWGQMRNLLPLAGHGLIPAVRALPSVCSYFDSVVYLAVFAGYIDQPRKLMRVAVNAMGTAIVALCLVVVLYLMVFPLPGGLDVPFPLFEMSRLVEGGRFMERVDSIWIIFWTFGSAGRLATSLLASSLLFQTAFRFPTHRGAILSLTMVVLSVALVPSNQAGAVEMELLLVRAWGYLFVPVLPLAIALLYQIRHRHA